MKIGIMGEPSDQQCRALEQALIHHGAEVVIVDSPSINQGVEFSYKNGEFIYKGQALNDVKAWFLRYVMSPLPPVFQVGEQYVLFSDWLNEYMHRQERYSFEVAMLLSWEAQGIPVVNPPEHGGVLQIKTFQLDAARRAGLNIPRTLVTNQQESVKAFLNEIGAVVYKPSMGGAACRPLDEEALGRLDLLTASPVIFQERVQGVSVRVTIVGEEVVSCVRIPSSTLDYRENPAYKSGQQIYLMEHLPQEIARQCVVLMHACGLFFSGIDFILQDDGRWVFLEANSSPVYMDIERKTQTSITGALADYLLLLANEPSRYKEAISKADRVKSFVKYALG